MSLTCAISNELPEHPVISPVSGCIFERRLIEKYLQENGTDPINGKELTSEQLIDIKTNPVVKPKAPTTTSIPAILKQLQDEWDALMLHSFTQRHQLQIARQELSHALYQHDAACRVIGRLTKELTAAREALVTLKPQTGVAANATAIPQPAMAMEAASIPNQPMEQAGMTADVIQKLQDKGTILTQERKRRGRSVPEELTSAERIRNFHTEASHVGLHSASIPGILSLDIQASDTSKILTGGSDKNAAVFNKDMEQVIAVFKGHTKKVTKVIYHPEEDVVITASPDTTIRVWNVGASQQVQLLRAHDAPVTGLSLHPTGDYVLSTSTDQHWAFSDIRTGKLLTKVADQNSIGISLTTAQLHPDGLIFGTGTSDSQIKIWDLKEQSNVANFSGHTGPITAISFSENGYYLATAAEDSCVRLWDLRKLKTFRTLNLDDDNKKYEVRDLCFDQSGTYLAVAGSDVRVYLCKQWEELKVFNDHTAAATGVRFGRHAQYIASTSMDRTLKIYGLNN
ncbi:pre-mRNA-processing factor 19 [Planococcus citri]|uniref:pre-mRNA-processing factor 19 n=1 Tax=Planococcus citri TaxID=170843 RepID=UPI0031F77B0F